MGCDIFLTEDCWKVYESGSRYFMPVIVEAKEEESGLHPVYCPVLPGACSQGTSKEDALKNIKEALTGVMEAYLSYGEEIPMLSNDEIDPKAKLDWVTIDVQKEED